MKKFFLIILILIFSILNFSRDKMQVKAILSENNEYTLSITKMPNSFYGAGLIGKKLSELKDGKVKIIFKNEKGEMEVINSKIISYPNKAIDFSPLLEGNQVKKFISKSDKISILIEDKKGTKLEEINFDVSKLNEN